MWYNVSVVWQIEMYLVSCYGANLSSFAVQVTKCITEFICGLECFKLIKFWFFFILLQDLLKKSMNDVFYIHLNVCVSTLKVFYVDGEDIQKVSRLVPKSLKPITGTMKIHQLWTVSCKNVLHRTVSCFCSRPMQCTCFGFAHVTLDKKKTGCSRRPVTDSRRDVH